MRKEDMMDKDKVLPIAVIYNHISYWGAVAQRDADWERVKQLIKVLEDIVSYPTTSDVIHMFQVRAREALGE